MDNLLKLAKENWHKPIGLLFSIILAFTILYAFLSQFTIPELYLIVIYCIVFSATSIFWYKNNRVRKRKKDKVGFIISIATFDDIEESKIKEDFIESLTTIIRHGQTGNSFDVIVLPNHLAKKIKSTEDAYKIRGQSNAHFVLFGKVRLRKIGGINTHVINLDGMVSHKPMLEDSRSNLKKEFKELFPRNVNISEENDLILFEFTSTWTVMVAKYIIGIAAAMSGDLNYAENLFVDLKNNLKTQNHNFSIFKKLNNRLPRRLYEIADTKASLAYEAYLKTDDDSFLGLMRKELDKVPRKYQNQYKILLLESIYSFLVEKNITKAISVLKKCKRNRDGTWRLNLAFLYSYMGDLKHAYREYSLVQKMSLEDSTLIEIESFICDVLKNEPSKYQLYYSLGVINSMLKGDIQQAKIDYKKFLELKQEDEYKFEENYVKEWLEKNNAI